MTLVLGIDPGSLHTGWGLVRMERQRLRYVASGVITASGEMPARLQAIADGVERVLADNEPSIVAIESLFHHKNSQSALKLGHARGVALLCVARAAVELFEYSPAEIKRAATGNGRASKDQVARMVKMILGHRGELRHDASDALATAICYAQSAPRLRAALR